MVSGVSVQVPAFWPLVSRFWLLASSQWLATIDPSLMSPSGWSLRVEDSPTAQ